LAKSPFIGVAPFALGCGLMLGTMLGSFAVVGDASHTTHEPDGLSCEDRVRSHNGPLEGHPSWQPNQPLRSSEPASADWPLPHSSTAPARTSRSTSRPGSFSASARASR